MFDVGALGSHNGTASRGHVVAIIDPEDSRAVLTQALEACLAAPRPKSLLEKV